MTVKVLDPTAEGPAAAARSAAPLGRLQGTTIGILDNGKIRVDRFCDFVEEILREEHGVTAVVRRRKRNASAPAPADLMADLLACDGVISAVGDWGSCSSCSLHDAVTAEKAGTPAAAVMTDAFVATADALARACGMPGYPYAVIAHPIAPDDDEALRRKAEAAVQRCVELLTRRQPG